MYKFLFLPLTLLLLLSTGCRSLPRLKAEEIHTNTTFMGVAITADALGVSHTPATMKATFVEWRFSFPGFSHTTSTKNYEQKVSKPEVEK